MSTASPSSTATTPSPAKAKYSTLTRERLEKLFDDSLRKLKARDKELAAVTADRADLKLQVQTASEALAHQDGLTEQLKAANHELDSVKQQLSDVKNEYEALQESKEVSLKIEDLVEENGILVDQLTALKSQIREAAAARDAEIAAAKAPLLAKIEELEEKLQAASRMGSMVRSARMAASKADGQMQVLEGALAGVQAKVASLENRNGALEQQIKDFDQVQAKREAEREELLSEHQLEISGRDKQIKTLEEKLFDLASVTKKENDSATIQDTVGTGHPVEQLNAQESCDAIVAELRAQVQRLQEAAVERETAFSQKVQETTKGVDAAFTELKDTAQALAETNAEKEAQTQELSTVLDDREMHIEDLEGRVANAEAAMHTATATMEEQAEALSPSAQAGPTEDKSPEEALLEPRLPDISEKGLSRGANLHSEQVEQLEELVAELRAELQDLQESHVHQRGQLQATQEELDDSKQQIRAMTAQQASTSGEDNSEAHGLSTRSDGGEETGKLVADLGAAQSEIEDLQSKLAAFEDRRHAESARLEVESGLEALSQEQDDELSQQPASRQNGELFKAEGGLPTQVKALNEEKANLMQELQDAKQNSAAFAERQQAEHAKKQTDEVTQVEDLEEEVAKLEAKVAQLEGQSAAHHSQDREVVSSTDGEAFAAREDVSAGLAESEIIKDLEGELSNTQLELGSTQKQIVELDDQLRHAKSQSETASSSMAALEGQIQRLRDDLASSSGEASKTIAQLDQSQTEYAELQEQYETLKAETLQLQTKIADLTAESEARREDQNAADAKQQIALLNEQLDASKASLAKEKEKAHRFVRDLNRRLEKTTKELKKAEGETQKTEVLIAEARTEGKAEMQELERQLQAAKKECEGLLRDSKHAEAELSSYKVRAHALLKSKDAELRVAKESAEAAAASSIDEARSALKAAEEKVLQLQKALAEAEANAREQMQDAESRLSQAVSELREAAEEGNLAAESAGQNAEQWRRRYEALEVRLENLRAENRQSRDLPPHLLQKHLDELAEKDQELETLKEEFNAFKDTAEQVAEAKDAELERLLTTNAGLKDEITILNSRQEISAPTPRSEDEVRSPWSHSRNASHQDDGRSFYSVSSRKASGSFANNLGLLSRRDSRREDKAFGDDSWGLSEGRAPSDWGFALDSSGLQESNLLRLAGQQARREEELTLARQRAAELEAEVADLSREVELRQEQEVALKEAMREAEREKARASLADKQRLDIEYLKNTVLKLYETGQAPVLLPAIAMLLHFSPAEVKRCQDAMARQAERLDEALPQSSNPNEAEGSSYLGGWATWAFGEGESAER